MRVVAFAAVAAIFASATAAASVDITMTYEPGPKPVAYAGANAWVPTGVSERVGPLECQAPALEESLTGARDLASQRLALRAFFERCEQTLARFGQHHLLSLLRLKKAEYRFLENPNIREVKFELRELLPDGLEHSEIIRGLVAVKPDAGPRPWILLKCGLFCSVSDSTLFRNFLMHAFDESPFNVLVLNGNTGTEYYLDNHRISMGGFDEGRQNIQIADWLRRSSPFKDNISSLHLVGVSKGGQGALFASAYNRFFTLPDGKRPLDSVAALCPVVDLGPSLTYVFERSLARALFYREFIGVIREVYSTVPALQKYVDLARPPQPNEITRVVGDATLDYYSRMTPDWALAPFLGRTTETPEEFWTTNNFSAFADTIATPTMVWAPKNDDIVNYADNSAKLEAAAGGRSPNPDLFLLNSAHGNHCGFSLAYGWDVTSSILRAHVLAHSPEFAPSRRVSTQTIDIPRPELAANERHITQEWVATAGSNELKLSYKIWKGDTQPTPAVRCEGDPFASAELCYEKRVVMVPVASLPIAGLAVPETETNANAFTRWLNATVRLLDSEGNTLTNSDKAPAQLRWTTYAP